ncbi:MAG: hypothetical protein E7541_04175 [Ruminococcaceae bacterium]|nr:hypothetical protein [Oscillospiraceae bacterium]
MTYRGWKKEIKRLRRQATPDIADRLPFSGEISTARPMVWRRVTAAAAAAVVLVGACLTGMRYWPTSPQSSAVSGGEELVVTPTPDVAPVQHTSVKLVALRHAGTGTAYDRTCTYVGVRTMQVSNPAAVEGHASCEGVFYNMEKQTYFCAQHVVQEALVRHGLGNKAVYFHYYHPALQRVLFTVNGGSRPSYCYDIAADTLQKLPMSLHQCPGITAMGTSPYVVLPRLGGDRDELFLVDMRTGDARSVLRDNGGRYLYTPMDDGHLSHDGGYVLFTLSGGGPETVNSPRRTTVAYEIATGKSRTFTGEIHAEIPGTTRLLIKNPDGYAVHDLATGQTVPYAEAGLPGQYRWQVQKTDDFNTSFGVRINYRLRLYDRETGRYSYLYDRFVDAHTVSADGRYVYYYVRGEDYIRVRDLLTGADEAVAVDEDFRQETEVGEMAARSVLFTLWLDDSTDELLLGYTALNGPREDPEEAERRRQQVPYYAFTQLLSDGQVTSLAALEPVLERYPSYVTAYEGNGHIYLDVTGLYTDEDGLRFVSTFTLVEDYTEHIFHRVTHQGSIATFMDDEEVGAIPADAEQQTRAMLARLQIPLQPSEKDYPYYFKKGEMFLRMEAITGEEDHANIRAYFVRKQNGYTGVTIALESPEDMEELWEFLAFTDTLTYERLATGEADAPLRKACRYTVELVMNGDVADMPLIQFGQYQGKAVLLKCGCLATITDADLERWSAWADKQEPKCHVD